MTTATTATPWFSSSSPPALRDGDSARPSVPAGPARGADATRPGPQAAPAAGKEVPTAPATYFSSGRRSSWSLRSSSSTRWPKGSEEMDTMLESVTLLSLLPVRTSWSCEWL